MLLGKIILLLAIASSVDAFSPINTVPQHTASPTSRQLFTDPDKDSPNVSTKPVSGNEKTLTEPPKEISSDKKFAFVQGQTDKSEDACSSCIPPNLSKESKERLEKILRPRPYPLFLAEKAAKVVGDAFRSKSDVEDPTATKERVVILGTGWGCAAMLQDKELADKYDVTVVSPRNHFVYTPMLAGSAVGTVEPRSVTEPIREFNLKANYLEATALYVDQKARTITCQGVVCDEECEVEEFEVPYDRLIVSVGARTNTFGIPGVEENCEFLKEVEQARSIRRKIVNAFERANFPNMSDEARRQFLTFAVIGAGPTGVEFTSELRDFVEEDVPKYWPNLLQFVNIKLVDAAPSVLMPFDKSLQDAAIDALNRRFATTDENDTKLNLPEQIVEVILDAKVKEITEGTISLSNGREIDYGVAVWAGGIGPRPITLDIIEGLGKKQTDCQSIARGKVAIDPYLRALGGEGRIFAIGDCACVKSACLPSNAQVASQQGEYLAHLLTHSNMTALYELDSLLPPRVVSKDATDSIAALAMGESEFAAPFQLLDLGILAYTSQSSALAQVKVGSGDKAPKIKIKGRLGFAVWRSVYVAKSPSMRNRFLLFMDWAKAKMFGRDITLID